MNTRALWTCQDETGGYVIGEGDKEIGRAATRADAHLFKAAPKMLRALHLARRLMAAQGEKTAERQVINEAIEGAIAEATRGGA